MFRIVEYADGYGRRWFRPQYRRWGIWRAYNFYIAPHSDKFDPQEFQTRWEAEEFLARKIKEALVAERRKLDVHHLDQERLCRMALKLRQSEISGDERGSHTASSVDTILKDATYTLNCSMCGDIFNSLGGWDLCCPKCGNKPKEDKKKPARKRSKGGKKKSDKK
jgi:hypothetical protein